MISQLVISTHNPHKREELLRILRDEMQSNIEILTLEDIHPPIGDIEETGLTLEDNALIKALAVHEKTGLPTIADDTGLEVDALNGEPGVFSARYSGENATYASNVTKLLFEMQGKTNRNAKFSTVIAFIDEGNKQHFFRGEVAGEIALAASGSNGFGYDPVFIPDGQPKTFAEMTSEEKNSVSHRSRALRKFADYLSNKCQWNSLNISIRANNALVDTRLRFTRIPGELMLADGQFSRK
jgi:XTP/dITP diphosphohydrolase